MIYGNLVRQSMQESSNVYNEANSIELALNERAVFCTLTESIEVLDIIQESKFIDGLKNVGKKILGALRWLKERIKEIVAKIKEKFRSKKSKEMEAKIKELEKALADSNANAGNIESSKKKLEDEITKLKDEMNKYKDELGKSKEDYDKLKTDSQYKLDQERKDRNFFDDKFQEMKSKYIETKKELEALNGMEKLAKNPVAGFDPNRYIINTDASRMEIGSIISSLKGRSQYVAQYISKDQNAQKALQKQVIASIDKITEKFGQNLEKLFVFDTKKFGINKIDNDAHEKIDASIANFVNLAGPNGVTSYIKEDLERIPEADRTKDIAKKYRDCKDEAWAISRYYDLTVNQISELESIVNSLFNTITTSKLDTTYNDNKDTEAQLRTAKDLDMDVTRGGGFREKSRKEVLYSAAPVIKNAMSNYRRIINVLKINVSVVQIISQYCAQYCGLIEGAAKSITYEYNPETYSGKYKIEM